MDPGILRVGFKFQMDGKSWRVRSVSVTDVVTSVCEEDEGTNTMTMDMLQKKFADGEATMVDQS